MAKPRNTKQRQLILSVLQGTKSHPSADWVYQQVVRTMPKVSLGTIYRNLGMLKKQEQIQELRHSCGQSRYDGNPFPHHHFFCVKCSKIVDVPLDYREDLDRILGNEMPEYEVLGHSTDFYGLCPDCKDKTEGKE